LPKEKINVGETVILVILQSVDKDGCCFFADGTVPQIFFLHQSFLKRVVVNAIASSLPRLAPSNERHFNNGSLCKDCARKAAIHRRHYKML
jgi:hypothetical protein